MKIGVLNWRDSENPDSGGAEVFVHEVAAQWAEQGHDVTLYSSTLPRETVSPGGDGIRVVRHGSLKRGGHHLLAPRRALIDKPDVVLESINTIPYFLPWRRRFVPFVPLVHQMALDVWKSHLPSPLARAARFIEPRLYLPYRNTPCTAVSDSTRQDLLDAGVKRVAVIPQGGIGPQKPPTKESDPTFVFVGRLAANKRPQHAIEAFRTIRRTLTDARLLIIGEGELKDEIAASLPDGASMLGRVPRGELLNALGRSHILLISSVREGWGLVVTEANALGTPAIGYDVPGLRDSIRPSITGRLTSPTPIALAEAAVELMSDQNEYERLRSNAIDWGSRCTWEKTSLSLMERLQEAISGSFDRSNG
jgi:glycosyltransferase involved in cell wall biosynthesis